MGFHLLLLFLLGRFTLYIQWYRFRFRVGILPGLGWGRIKNYHLAFGIQAQLKCNIRYIYTYFWVGLDFEIANSYYFFVFAFAFEVYIVSLL